MGDCRLRQFKELCSGIRANLSLLNMNAEWQKSTRLCDIFPWKLAVQVMSSGHSLWK